MSIYKYIEYPIEIRSNIPDVKINNSLLYSKLSYWVRIQYNITKPLDCLVIMTNRKTEEEFIFFTKELPSVIKNKLQKVTKTWDQEVLEERSRNNKQIQWYETNSMDR